MIDPLTHAMADAIQAFDRGREHVNIGYLEYYNYALAAIDFLKAQGYDVQY